MENNQEILIKQKNIEQNISEKISSEEIEVNLNENKLCLKSKGRYFDFDLENGTNNTEKEKKNTIDDILNMSLPSQKLLLKGVIKDTNESFLSKKRFTNKNL